MNAAAVVCLRLDRRLPSGWTGQEARPFTIKAPNGDPLGKTGDSRLVRQILAADPKAAVLMGRRPRIILSDADAYYAAHHQFSLAEYMSDDRCDHLLLGSGQHVWQHRPRR